MVLFLPASPWGPTLSLHRQPWSLARTANWGLPYVGGGNPQCAHIWACWPSLGGWAQGWVEVLGMWVVALLYQDSCALPRLQLWVESVPRGCTISLSWGSRTEGIKEKVQVRWQKEERPRGCVENSSPHGIWWWRHAWLLCRALGARYLGTCVRLMCAPWLGSLSSDRFLGVPPGPERLCLVNAASLRHAAVWRPRPSWSSSEVWQVEHPAAFFLPGCWQLSDFKAGTHWPGTQWPWHKSLLSLLLLSRQKGGSLVPLHRFCPAWRAGFP